MKPCACEAIVIRHSSVNEMRKHATALFAAHYEEVGKHDTPRLDPNWEQHFALEDAGMLFVIAAWHDKALVGYSVNLIVPSAHDRAYRYVENRLLFIDPEHRGGSLCTKLMLATGDHARELGLPDVRWHCKEGTALHCILKRKPGCALQDLVYKETL